MSNRPYSSIKDFMKRCPLNKTAMISLIKGGAFDRLEKQWGQEENKDTRILVMAYYISQVCEPKKRITLQNFNGLMQYNLIPQDLDFQKRVFIFNKYLKTYKKVGKYYVFDESCINFYEQFFDNDLIEIINGCTCILQTRWDKIYKDEMDLAREYFKNNQNELLNKYNTILFQEMWNKYAKGSLSAWEMEALCFYYHEHELAKVNRYKYGIVDFFHLSEKPEVDYTFKRNGQDIPIFKTYKIIGTVINKNDTKSSINLLTTTGIVSVKFTKEYYAMFNRQLSEKQEDGTKKIVEKGWMARGTKLMITGFRRDDTFVGKTYSRTPTHQLYLIESVDEEGNMTLRHERYQVKEEEI